MRKFGLTLNALQAFEAVARHGSFKQAATELGVTPSAVSHQVALLERQLRARLLRRDARRVELTAYGAALLPKLSAGFGMLADAVADHLGRLDDGPPRITLLDTFALHWLLPRMVDYPFEQRGFHVSLETTPRAVSFETENLDLAIRLGHGAWSGLEADLLFPETLALYAGAHPLARQAEGPVYIARQRLDDWAAWLERFGEPAHRELPLVEVDSTALAIKATLLGTGLGFLGCELVQDEEAAGRLVRLGAGATPSVHGGYWLVYPKLVLRDPRAQKFRAWLLAQAAA